jgi:hypothetical protein
MGTSAQNHTGSLTYKPYVHEHITSWGSNWGYYILPHPPFYFCIYLTPFLEASFQLQGWNLFVGYRPWDSLNYSQVPFLIVTPQIHFNAPYTFFPDVIHHMSKLCTSLYHDDPKVWLYLYSCIVLGHA